MFTKTNNPTRAVVNGRDSWVFPDGKTLPVVAGGDHSATPEVRTLVDIQKAKRAELDDGIVARASEAIALAETEQRVLTDEEAQLVRDAATATRELDETIEAQIRIQRGNDVVAYDRPAERDTGGAIVRTEPTTYGNTREAAARGDNSFFKDHAAAGLGLNGAERARERLARHAQEMEVESRAGSTGDTAGGTFVPPLWVLSEFADYRRPGRATANLARQIPLPAGTDSVNIPTITTGTKVATQATENSAVTSRDIVTGSTTAEVTTIAGIYDFSIQLLEQSPLAGGWDQLVFVDMVADYDMKYDLNVLAGTGASNENWGLRTVAATSVTVGTAAGTALYSGIADGLNRVATTLYRTPQVVVMHPRRWFWLASRTDTTGRPLVVADAGAAQNLLAAMGVVNHEGAVGTLGLGIPVVIDSNITTTSGTWFDEVYVWRPSEAISMESTPRFEVFRTIGGADEPLTARARLYNYAAFTTRFATSVAIVTGAGLTGPTF